MTTLREQLDRLAREMAKEFQARDRDRAAEPRKGHGSARLPSELRTPVAKEPKGKREAEHHDP
jgi:hypothetical protein